MRKAALFVLVLCAIAAPSAVGAKSTSSGINLRDATCTVVNNSFVQCAGTLTGLGNVATAIQLVVPAGCVNKPGHEPPGHQTTTTAPIQPRAGRVDFGPGTGNTVQSQPLDCPPGLSPVFGDQATLNIIQNGQVVASFTVPID